MEGGGRRAASAETAHDRLTAIALMGRPDGSFKVRRFAGVTAYDRWDGIGE